MADVTPASIVEGERDERVRHYRVATRGFLIVNYEQLLRDIDEVIAIDPDLVVIKAR